MMQQFALKRELFFHFILLLMLSCAGIEFCLKTAAFRNYYFTSDNLYMFNYFYSLKNGILSSFQYSHLPTLFPDGAIILPLLALGMPWQLVYVFYSVVMFLTLSLSIRKIYMAINPNGHDESFYLLVIFSIFLFLLHPGRFLHVLMAGEHGGSFVISMLNVVLVWRILSDASRQFLGYLCGLVLLTGVTVFSDILFVFEFVLPLIAVSTVLMFLRWIPVWRILVLNVAVIVAAFLGGFVLHLLPLSPFPSSRLGDLWQNFLQFCSSMQMSIILASVLPFLVVSFCFIRCVCCGRGKFQMNAGFSDPSLVDVGKSDAWVFYWIFGLTAAISGFGITAIAYQGFGSYRYAIAFFWWPAILGFSLLAGQTGKLRLFLPKLACIGVVFLFFGAIALPTAEFWASNLANCLEDKSKIYSMHAGLAEYETARPLTEFLQRKHIVSQVVENGDPMIWINNRLDYFSDVGGKNLLSYDFIILNGLDKDRILQKFGMPSHRFKCDAYDIVQYDDPLIIDRVFSSWFAEHK